MGVVAGGKLGRMIFWGLLLLEAALVSLVNGQAGVSLRYRGETLPSDSFVDLDDVLNIGSGSAPTNRNPGTNGAALECITDLVDCCGTESGTVRNQHGNWYFPDGTSVALATGASRFLVNRGPNEIINGQQFNGSVRLYRVFSGITERGRFRCEIPNADDPSVNQDFYVNILNFATNFNDPHVITSSSGSNTAGEVYSLMCSSTLNDDSSPLPTSVQAVPSFVWSFGPSGNDPLPSDVTDMGTTSSDSITFTSTLQFSLLSQSLHAGMYTCRLGPARLVTNTMITVNAPPISVTVTANFNTPLMVGQTDNTLTCDVSGAGNLNPSTTYRWTRNGGGEVGSSRIFTISSARLSSAGNYTCSATVTSGLLINDVTMSASQIVMVQIPASPSVTVSSSTGSNTNPRGSAVTVNCEVDFGQLVMESELSLLTVEAELFQNGTQLTLDAPIMSGSRFIFGYAVSSFNESNVGGYHCTATVRPAPSSQFLTGTGQGTSPLVTLTIGIPPTEGRGNARCYSGGDIAIAVVVYTLIECLLAAPVITAVVVLCWKRNQRKPSQYKSTSDTATTLGGFGEVHPGEDVYEDPDKTAAPGNFKLTECAAYVTTTTCTPQPSSTTEAQLQSGHYEL